MIVRKERDKDTQKDTEEDSPRARARGREVYVEKNNKREREGSTYRDLSIQIEKEKLSNKERHIL